MWEQLMQMLQSMPQQGIPMPQGMAGAAQPQQANFPPAPPPASGSDMAQRIAGVAKAFEKGAGSVPTQQAPQVATPPPPRPSMYVPGSTPNGLGAGGGGDIVQMLTGLPGMAAMLGQGAGGGMPQQITGLTQQPGAGMPSLAELMAMSRR